VLAPSIIYARHVRVQWYGQSAFRLTGTEHTVFIDPFGDMSQLTRDRGLQFDYPPIEDVAADLLLITHEHRDHNCAEAIGGDPVVIRSTAGRLESPVGEVTAIASEHDEAAGTLRGPNTIFAFELDGLRVAHFGDFGQSALRDEQATALGDVDLVIIPVGGGPTIDASQASTIVGRLAPRWVVPMHYRTPRIGFLDTEEAFTAAMDDVHRVPESAFETSELPAAAGPLVVVPATP
jgi:L-ascorbate metabolism protein UlaG (beta-lactamase superfamily)